MRACFLLLLVIALCGCDADPESNKNTVLPPGYKMFTNECSPTGYAFAPAGETKKHEEISYYAEWCIGLAWEHYRSNRWHEVVSQVNVEAP